MDNELSVLQMLDAEDRALGGPQVAEPPTRPTLVQRLHKAQRSALCLSGGGIRSAAFGLGVIQALAARSADPGNGERPKLLGEFDYLSTVSGGGYLGSWFSAWATRLAKPASRYVRLDSDETLDGPAEVIRQLAKADNTALFDPDVAPVAHLREFSNYLTPQLGLLSGDTWALVGSVVRNMLLNWLVLIPLAAAALLLPCIAVQVTSAPVMNDITWIHRALLAIAFVSGATATAYIGFDLPSAGDARLGYRGHLWCCLVPLTISAIAFNLLWAWMPQGAEHAPFQYLSNLYFLDLGQLGLTWRHFAVIGAAMYGGGMLAGIVGAMVFLKRPAPTVGLIATGAAVVTGAIGGLVASRFTLAALHFSRPIEGGAATMYTVTAFSLVIGVFLLAASLLAGATSFITEDKDREWWARSGGLLLSIGLAWPILAAIVLYLEPWVADHVNKLTIHSATMAAGWALSQLAGSASTPSQDAQSNERSPSPDLVSRAKQIGAKALLPVFIVLLAVSLSVLNAALLNFAPSGFGWIRAGVGEAWPHADAFGSLGPIVVATHGAVALLVMYLAIAFVASYFINVNSFSLHGMYRQRLIRAFLGASTAPRRPNGFTGFDAADNMAMAALTTHRPLHVVNMALNLVHGSNLAWQQRKAEPFTVTRLHAGSSRIGFRPTALYGGRYREHLIYKPISLGTAMTISGAAASPNMGYNSSPMLALVMTLFNARLGCWLGNPRSTNDAWKLPGPAFALRPLLAEAFGLTDDKNNWIYLSDGGHFENLALYEMVLRRCARIVVSDAGADPTYSYEDLGNAVRKIRIDLGIPIEFDKAMPMSPDRKGDAANTERPGHHCAIGRIRYGAIDPGAPDGVLIYLKPSLTGDEPADVLHYASTDPTFPHQTTIDQFFSEAQFESYRRLGAHVIEHLCEVGKPSSQEPTAFDLAQFEDRARRYRESTQP